MSVCAMRTWEGAQRPDDTRMLPETLLECIVADVMAGPVEGTLTFSPAGTTPFGCWATPATEVVAARRTNPRAPGPLENKMELMAEKSVSTHERQRREENGYLQIRRWTINDQKPKLESKTEWPVSIWNTFSTIYIYCFSHKIRK